MHPSRSRSAIAAALSAMGLVLVLGFVAFADAPKAAPSSDHPSPSWIWIGEKPRDGQTVYFRKEFDTPKGLKSAKLVATCDDSMTVYLDGKSLGEADGWASPIARDLTRPLGGRGGKHVLAVRGQNGNSAAGLLVRLVLETGDKQQTVIVTDASWRASEQKSDHWADRTFDDSKWAPAHVVGTLGSPPWTAVNETLLSHAGKLREPTATDPKQLKVAKGFNVELLYTVPKDEQGSWVSMTIDPKGRLIVSDQYGKLYRVTPHPVGAPAAAPKIEPIDVALGEAQGMTWAFDSLYVVVNQGAKYHSGLYRVRDTDGDDKLDRVEKLRGLNGGGEHGPHAVMLSPDGKSLYVVAGNGTQLTTLAGSLVPRIWGEDQILPFMPDGRGFMTGERAPGGCVYRVSPDGKEWTLVSMGYRNSYDMAFNRDGELFTYDSDMEWDMSLPWYRPTRVCDVVSGSDFGYRNGSGKYPVHYIDSLPPTVNVGPGSPTGVAFGYGAKFPGKYQEALYLCDWSYGKLYATHLKPEGASYVGELEEFVTGTPLPLTDMAVNPKDGALYFAIGGRKVQSGLYRVTYTGSESTAPVTVARDAGSDNRALRRQLEAFHGHQDPQAVATAWPHLGHADRFIRYAARVAIEFQDPASWREKALSETKPAASLTALLALSRVSAPDPMHRKPTDPAPDATLRGQILDALSRLKYDELSESQKLELLRVYEVLLNRMGRPDDAAVARITALFDAYYPASSREQNSELSKLLVYLQSPDAAQKTLSLLAQAPTQEEQIDFAASLRMLKAGWTPALRREYFSWFPKAASFKGGPSIEGFLNHIKRDAVANLTPEEKAELKPILEARPQTQAATQAPRPFVKEWKLDELTALADKGLTQRNFDKGRALFAAANCYSCHRYNNEGGAAGPDLSSAAGRFSARDLLESIVEPSKVISDQYGAVDIATADGRVIHGRIMNLGGDSITVNTNMLDPSAQVGVDRKQVEEIKPSKVSMMPAGLLNTLNQEEVLDLLAYLLSRGDRTNKMFK